MPTYSEMAAHYGVAIIPARAYKPRDKAKVEVAVLVAERWVMARLRDHHFTSLAAANTAITELVGWVNNRPFKKLAGSRQALFEQLDRPALRPLPATPYEFATWRRAKANIDYHVEVRADRHFYSVPYRLVGEVVDVRLAAATVEVFSVITGSPPMCAASSPVTRPTRPTCPSPTAATPAGRRRASSPGPATPGRPRPSWPRRCWPAGPTPNRALGPAWA